MPHLARWVSLPSPDRVALHLVHGEGDLMQLLALLGVTTDLEKPQPSTRSAPARRVGRVREGKARQAGDPGPLSAAGGAAPDAHRED